MPLIPAAYLRMLQRAQEFSATIAGVDMEAIKVRLEWSYAFKGHEEAGSMIMEK